MNKTLYILLFIFISIGAIAQPIPGGKRCELAAPICTDFQYDFPLQTDASSEIEPYYDCLSTQPNPAWYYFVIGRDGLIGMDLHAMDDIDYIIWGPFSHIVQNPSLLTSSKVVDCSYSASAQEWPEIPNAQVGQVYMMLITNYANEEQNFALSQISGTGRTDCSIVNSRCSINAGPDQTICLGDSTIIQAVSTIENSIGSYTITWDVVDRYINDSTRKICANSSSQTFMASITTEDGCFASDFVTIIGHEEPTPVVASQHFCQGAVSAPLYVSGNNVKWYDQPGGTAYPSPPTPQTALPGDTKYYVTTSLYGCESDPGELTVTIHPIPTVTISALDTDLCEFESTSLIGTSSTTGGNGNWIGNGVTEIDETHADFLGISPGLSQISYTYTAPVSEGSCVSLPISVQINVRATPLKPTVNELFENCLFETPQPIVVVGSDIKWYDAPIGGAQLLATPTINTSFINSNTWYVTQSDGDCESEPAEVTSIVYDIPRITLQPTELEICSESKLQINALVLGGNPGFEYLWTGNGASKLSSISIPNPKFSSIESTNKEYNISLLVTDSVGCTADSTFIVDVYALPTVTIETDDENNIICEDVAVTLTAHSPTAISYIWKNNGHMLGNTPEISLTPGETFTYQVIVADENSCVNYTNQKVTVVNYPEFSLEGSLGNCVGTIERQYEIATTDSLTDIQWKFSSGIITYTRDDYSNKVKYIDFLSPGFDTISIMIKNIGDCISYDTIVIRTVEYPEANFESYNYSNTNPIYFENLSTQTPVSEGSTSEEIGMYYIWDFYNNPDSALFYDTIEHIEMIPRNFMYGITPVTLYAINEYGCLDSITLEVTLESYNRLFIPTAFAPENEALGVRTFQALGINLKTCDVWVYDSWGNILWHGNTVKNGLFVSQWDGTFKGEPLKSDTYIWKAEATFLDGFQWDGKKLPNGEFTKLGNVVLIR